MQIKYAGLALGVLANLSMAGAASVIFDASTGSPSPRVSAAELAALKRLYAAQGAKTCTDFEVLARQQGQFTAHRKQTLYLVQNCYDDAAINPARERWRGDLLILDVTRLNYFKRSFADDVKVLPGLNGETLNALLTQNWFGPYMDEFFSVGEIMHFSGGRYRQMLNLGPVYSDQDSNGTAYRRVLRFDAARPNLLQIDEFASPYCNCKTAQAPYAPALAKLTLRVSVDLRRPPTKANWQQ